MNNVLFENKQLFIKDNGNGIIFFKIIGFVNIDLMKLIDVEMTNAIRKTKTKKIISDTSKMKVMSPEAQQYNNDVLIANWERLGIKYNALILSSDAFAKWSLQVIKQKYETRSSGGAIKKGFLVNMFENEETAMEWIAEQK